MQNTLDISILNPREEVIGVLNPEYTQIKEYDKLKGFRRIKITHSLLDEGRNINPLRYSEMLIIGNKVFRQMTCNGDSCLYIIIEDRKIDPYNQEISVTAEEVACELSNTPPRRFNPFVPDATAPNATISITAAFLESHLSNYFRIGTVETGQTFEFSGSVGLMELIREIEKQTGFEFQFKYQFIRATNRIHRYVDFIHRRGKKHNIPIEIGYTASSIELEESENSVRIGAAPRGNANISNRDNALKYHKRMKSWENFVAMPGTNIPLFVTKKAEGKIVNGPLANPPYPKNAGNNFVLSKKGDSAARYQSIHHREGSENTTPRIAYFTTNEKHPINIYWNCVRIIREKLQPSLKLDANVFNIRKFVADTPDFFNVGDTVFVRLPGRNLSVESRIVETTKDPRDPDNDRIIIGNHQFDFFDHYLGAFYSRSRPYTKDGPLET